MSEPNFVPNAPDPGGKGPPSQPPAYRACDGQQTPARSTSGPVLLAQVVESSPSKPRAAWESGWAIVGLLLVVGPFGLPALWFSRRFSRTTKLAGTIVCTLLTVVLPAVLIWYLYVTAIRPILNTLTG